MLQQDFTYIVVRSISSQLGDIVVVLGNNTMLVRMHQIGSCRVGNEVIHLFLSCPILFIIEAKEIFRDVTRQKFQRQVNA